MSYWAIFLHNIAALLHWVDWSVLGNFLTGCGTIALAYFALRGLSAWKLQTHTQHTIALLDSLIEATSAYIEAMRTPLTIFEYTIEIGIAAHASPSDKDPNAAIIRFIKKRGPAEAKKLRDTLTDVRPLASKMKMLAIKCHALMTQDGNAFYNACQMLEWSLNQLDSFAGMIDSDTLNWENPEIIAALERTQTVTAEKMRANLETHYAALIALSRKAYQHYLK